MVFTTSIHLFYFKYHSNRVCSGFKNTKAVMGTNIRPVEPNEFPSVVCINRYNPSVNWTSNTACTGTLLTNMFILTAEHCFDDALVQPYEISLGAHYPEFGTKYYPLWWVSYDQWTTFHDTLVISGVNDIMIIKIFGYDWHQIVPSSLGYIEDISVLYNANTNIVGCGKINTGEIPTLLHTGSVHVIDINDCRHKVSVLQGQFVPLTMKHFCTIGVPHTYIENGDSGGPLLYFGAVVGINIAVCPKMDGGVHDGQVNIHINLHVYKEFLNSIKINV